MLLIYRRCASRIFTNWKKDKSFSVKKRKEEKKGEENKVV